MVATSMRFGWVDGSVDSLLSAPAAATPAGLLLRRASAGAAMIAPAANTPVVRRNSRRD